MVERVVSGDGGVNESGITLLKGAIYGTVKQKDDRETFWTLKPGKMSILNRQKPDEIFHAAMMMGKRWKVSDGTQVKNENISEGASSEAGDGEDVSLANKPQKRSRVAGDARRVGDGKMVAW